MWRDHTTSVWQSKTNLSLKGKCTIRLKWSLKFSLSNSLNSRTSIICTASVWFCTLGSFRMFSIVVDGDWKLSSADDISDLNSWTFMFCTVLSNTIVSQWSVSEIFEIHAVKYQYIKLRIKDFSYPELKLRLCIALIFGTAVPPVTTPGDDLSRDKWRQMRCISSVRPRDKQG